jgi:hypothetical protein
MKRPISRRQFAKAAGAAAVLVPAAWSAAVVAGQSAPQQPAAPQEAEAKPRYGMSKEQEERVKQAIERRERQAANFRARALPYALEPAFVFKVRSKEAKTSGRQEKAKGATAAAKR